MDAVLPFWLAAKYSSLNEKRKEKENVYSPYVTFLLRWEFQFWFDKHLLYSVKEKIKSSSSDHQKLDQWSKNMSSTIWASTRWRWCRMDEFKIKTKLSYSSFLDKNGRSQKRRSFKFLLRFVFSLSYSNEMKVPFLRFNLEGDWGTWKPNFFFCQIVWWLEFLPFSKWIIGVSGVWTSSLHITIYVPINWAKLTGTKA